MLTKARQAEVTELCMALLRQKSYSGGEQDAVLLLRDYMLAHGFDEVRTDRFGSLIGSIQGKRPGKKVLFDGHLDTVPVGNRQDWVHDPFCPVIENGRIYGRGASDMKGAVAAFTAAAAFFAEDTGKEFCGEIHTAGTVYEECFEGVAAGSISALVRPDFVIIGEASGLDLNIGQRGRAELVVETFGVPAHSASPEKGVNAVYQMSRVVEAFRKLDPPEHPVLGKGILELTDIKSSPYPGASVVPEYCRATYDRRLLAGETRESVLGPLRARLERWTEEDPAFRAEVSFAHGEERCYTGSVISGERFFPAWLVDARDDFVVRIRRALQERGYRPGISCYQFCTNGSHYAGEKHIPTLGLGPSSEGLAHTVDESIEMEQLIGAADCYYGVMQALSGA